MVSNELRSDVATSSRPEAFITGIGAVTPFALGWHDVFGQMNAARPNYEEWGQELGRPFEGARLGLVRNLPAERYFDERQLRLMDRAMALTAVASAFAMEDAGILVDDRAAGGDEIATVLASSQGELPSLYRFGLPLFRSSERGALNPAQFPMIARNIACGQMAIRFGLQGWSTMISAGDISGAHAIARALELIALGRANTVVVGAFEVLAKISLHQLRQRWEKKGIGPQAPHTGDNVHVPVEGACFLVLESAARVRERHCVPYARISHASQGYRVRASERPWDRVLDRHACKAPTMEKPACLLHLRVGPGGGEHARHEEELRHAVDRHHGGTKAIDVRADIGNAGALTSLLQAALAAQLLSTRAGEAPESGRYPTGDGALLTTMTHGGAYSLISLGGAGTPPPARA